MPFARNTVKKVFSPHRLNEKAEKMCLNKLKAHNSSYYSSKIMNHLLLGSPFIAIPSRVKSLLLYETEKLEWSRSGILF
jgi:hypothetical protein